MSNIHSSNKCLWSASVCQACGNNVLLVLDLQWSVGARRKWRKYKHVCNCCSCRKYLSMCLTRGPNLLVRMLRKISLRGWFWSQVKHNKKELVRKTGRDRGNGNVSLLMDSGPAPVFPHPWFLACLGPCWASLTQLLIPELLQCIISNSQFSTQNY